MPRRFKPIETPLGFVHGRDGIYLDEVIFRDRTNTLVLIGSFNTSHCSAAPKDIIDFDSFRMTFNEVLAVQIIELDSWDFQCESSFDEILDSEWIRSLGGKVTATDRHFLIQTYDDVIEVVCGDFEIELTN
jgi:hypothetical protein